MTYRTDTAHGWFDGHHTTDPTKRAVDGAQTVLKAVGTGLEAAADYRRLNTRVSPEKAAQTVFEKYFGKH